jgi:hypothetical protein
LLSEGEEKRGIREKKKDLTADYADLKSKGNFEVFNGNTFG